MRCCWDGPCRMTEFRGEKLFEFRTSKGSYGPPFEAKRFYDPRFRATIVMVMPGRYYVTSDPEEMIVALLGSSVAVCIRDPMTGIGGLIHILIPERRASLLNPMDVSSKDGKEAMFKLIDKIAECGGDLARLEIKVFGGAGDAGDASSTLRGKRTADFVQAYLDEAGYKVAAQSLGGTQPRRVHYFPITGKVNLLSMRRPADYDLFKKERAYQSSIRTEDDADPLD